MDLKQGPPAGWYPHPSMAGTVRYWDGVGWTEHIAAAVARPPASMATGPSDALIGIGWTLAFLMPLAGFVIGIVVAARGSAGHGVGMVVGSVAVSSIWVVVNGGYI